MEDSLHGWFKREVLLHEAALLRYIGRVWRRPDEVHDLCQETYARVYESAVKSRPNAARSFLFATAQHLMVDRLRHERVVSIEAAGDVDALNVLVDEISAEQRVSGYQELKRLARALDLLPPKCREVIWLRRVEDLPQKEIAARLGIAEKTVEKHISKGGRLLADQLFGDGRMGGDAGGAVLDMEDDNARGKP